ncbi:MAG: endonuclease domain-containing protein [Candidatus Portnoybacteria bacterium]|nr:endonuclease domain-containing protein [Candidatus Portnoybacteria bacterium]MDD4982745.1 endonuclease domain-containing protein [Candidatus Portnoybacteria bacterium]
MNKKFVFNKSSVKIHRRDLRKASTDAERKLWSKLRNRQLAGVKFFRQYSVGPYILDFYCPAIRLGIEADGSQHDISQKEHDTKRTCYLEQFNINILRFWDNDILKNTDGVILKILEHITPPNLPLN